MKSLFRAARFGIESLRGSGVNSAREGCDHARRCVCGARYRGFGVDGRLLARPPAALGASRHDCAHHRTCRRHRARPLPPLHVDSSRKILDRNGNTMTAIGWAQIALVLALVVGSAIPLSRMIASVFFGERNFLSPMFGPVERGFYRLAGVDPAREQDWFAYTIAMVVFSIAGFLVLYGVQRLQNILPLKPRGFDAVPPDLALDTSISFITNTNWQNYSGETTMSHLTQMLGLTVHNFVSAATGLAMAFALVRGFARSSATTVGNFWVDVTRIALYVLLPLAIVLALAYVALGVPQTLAGSGHVS